MKSIQFLCIGLLIVFGSSFACAGGTDPTVTSDTALSAVDNDLKSIKIAIKKEFANQNLANAETKKNIIQLGAQNEAIVSATNTLKAEQELLSKRISENHQTLTQVAIALFIFIFLIFLSLWAINQKLKKGIAIRFGQHQDREAAAPKSTNNQSSSDNAVSGDKDLSIASREHGISAEEFQKLMSHQISNNTFSLNTSIPVDEKVLISAAMDAAIKKKMQGFMRPAQPPKM